MLSVEGFFKQKSDNVECQETILTTTILFVNRVIFYCRRVDSEDSEW